MTTEGPLHFGGDGLIPVVAQDAASGEVLMLAYMNEQALRRTQETGFVHYWSRSRNSLWLKGETSGNRQQLISIHVNCEQNSLLLKVMQQGAACHEGFDTCYYRSLRADGTLQVERDRVFDPELVYGHDQEAIGSDSSAVRDQFGAYEFLRDRDFSEFSSTSRRIRQPDLAAFHRVGDELTELAAVLTGEHVHQDRTNDIILESSQVMYWVYVASLGSGLTWLQVRPDVALTTPSQGVPQAALLKLLHEYAAKWSGAADMGMRDGALANATLSLIAQVCSADQVDPLAVVEFDLRELQSRPYLDEYFRKQADG
jgi:phosphoribosyl-AMP cyclohydrolase